MPKQYVLTEEQILSARQFPGVLYAQEAAFLLRKAPEDLHYLAKLGMLKELGSPKANAPKYFLTEEILKLKDDQRWQDRAIRMLTRKRRLKNQKFSRAKVLNGTS